MAEVPQVATPTTASEMTGAIARTYKKLEGQNPSGATLAILLGQWDLETGGGQSTFNWNVGNLKAFTTSQPFFVNPKVTNESNRFQAFDSLNAGVNAWVTLLARERRYIDVWAKAKAGDAEGFSKAIEASGYGGNPQTLLGKYTRAVLGRIQKYLKNLPTPSVKTIGIGLGVLLLAGATATTVWWLLQEPSKSRAT